MFYYRTSFSKKAIFLEKTAKNPFVEGHGSFEGRGAPGDKNQYNLFYRHRRFEYFLSYNFFNKNNIFQNIKNYFWGASPCLREGEGGWSDEKNEYNLFFSKWGTKYSF